MFGAAPRELARQISLFQTVELVRTTIDVVESADRRGDAARRTGRSCTPAIVQYSREVAFAAAEIYARAAELRGAWDARLEALVVDAVLRGETDETVLSRASTLGWRSTGGRGRRRRPGARRRAGAGPGGDPAHGRDRRDSTCSAPSRATGWSWCWAARADRPGDGAGRSSAGSSTASGPEPVVVGPPVEHLMDAAASTREALSRLPGSRRPGPRRRVRSSADDLLPERALSGDGHARRALARDIYDPLLGGRRRAAGDAGDASSTRACRSRRPPGRCSCTPTPSATGCAGSTR